MRALYIGLVFFAVSFTIISCNQFESGKEIKLIVEADFGEFIRNASNNSKDTLLNNAIKQTYIAKQTSGSGFFLLFEEVLKKENPGYNISNLFVNNSDLTVHTNASNAEVIGALHARANAKTSQTISILNTRLQKIVSSARADYDSGKGIITVTFKGKEYFDGVRACLLATGDLQFYEVYSNAEIGPLLIKVNDTLSAGYNKTKDVAEDNKPDIVESDKSNGDTASLGNYVGNKGVSKKERGKTEEAERRNRLFTVLQPNVNANEGAFEKGPVVGYAFIRDTAKVNKYLYSDIAKSILPPNVSFMYGQHKGHAKIMGKEVNNQVLPIYAVKISGQRNEPDANNIIKTKADHDFNGNPSVVLTFDSIGKKKFQRMTAQNIGNFIAIVFDGIVYSCPRVEGEISGGELGISGGSTEEEAFDLSIAFKSGKLPMPLRIIESNINE